MNLHVDFKQRQGISFDNLVAMIRFIVDDDQMFATGLRLLFSHDLI